VRTAEVRLGEWVAVIGLGLLGQLTIQILKAAGCRVIGIDLDPARIELARQLGAERRSPETGRCCGDGRAVRPRDAELMP
jgi:D-arabinose 1-dehydrogenase-like Zn-dependent alcohol dehydrogenase